MCSEYRNTFSVFRTKKETFSVNPFVLDNKLHYFSAHLDINIVDIGVTVNIWDTTSTPETLKI